MCWRCKIPHPPKVMPRPKRAIVSLTIAATFISIRPRAERTRRGRVGLFGVEEQNEKNRRGTVAAGLVRRHGHRADRQQGIYAIGAIRRLRAASTGRPSPAASCRGAEREDP